MKRMATQRLFIASVGGATAVVIKQLFSAWHVRPAAAKDAIDRFCAALEANSTALQILYFSGWIDHWLMGNLIPGPNALAGNLYEITCLSRNDAIAWASRCGDQFQEQRWLAARLQEAAKAWSDMIDEANIVVARQVFGNSVHDDEMLAALNIVPTWLIAEQEAS